MEIDSKFIIYRLEGILDPNAAVLVEVSFYSWQVNCFDTKEEAIEALISHKMFNENFVILEKVCIRN